ncbi:MAG: 3-phosphoshikimate 1-carboxyvinyltransferase [Firmicutes bacterium]|nr:3-phosphoshikimate 1-carboxyvinyltransferase [Bacillota bacterium]
MRITKAPVGGEVRVPGSKSMAERLILAWALSKTECGVEPNSTADDVAAMAECAKEIFAAIEQKRASISEPLNVRESGAVLRFVMPVLGALGLKADIVMEGRLPERPMEALTTQLKEHGMVISGPQAGRFHVEGQLFGGIFELPGNQSSQFITGLLMALPLLPDNSELKVIGEIQSRPYVDMTLKVLSQCGIDIMEEEPGDFYIPGNQEYRLEGDHEVEGDWSAAAFWLAMGAASAKGTRLKVKGVRPDSSHGDKAILKILNEMGAEITWEGSQEGSMAVTVEAHDLKAKTIDARNIPDLVPAIAIAAVAASGKTTIMNAERLRLKESDRLHAITEVLRSLGAMVNERPDGLEIFGGYKLHGGWVSSFGDHRIAMMAAGLRVFCEGDIEVDGAGVVTKSYPEFWKDYGQLGGEMEEIS